MSMRFEWATAFTPELVTPSDLEDLADDGNDDGDWGLAWSTGSNGCMVYGSLEDLRAMALSIIELVDAAEGA